jgi:hypothetical protein
MSNGQEVSLPGSGYGQNPFMQAGYNTSSTYDPSQYNQYNVGTAGPTGFNGGQGSYNIQDGSMPQFSANAAGAGQALSTGQMQNPQGLNAAGQVAPGSLGAQTLGNTQQAGAGGGAYSGNPFMQQLMQMFGQLPQFQNQAAGGHTPPAAIPPQASTQHVLPAQQPTVAQTGGAGWTQGTGLNSKLQNQGFNTGTGQNNMYQEMYNPKTQQYSFSNPYLHDLGGTASTAQGAEQLYNKKFASDAINPAVVSGLNYGGT